MKRITALLVLLLTIALMGQDAYKNKVVLPFTIADEAGSSYTTTFSLEAYDGFDFTTLKPTCYIIAEGNATNADTIDATFILESRMTGIDDTLWFASDTLKVFDQVALAAVSGKYAGVKIATSVSNILPNFLGDMYRIGIYHDGTGKAMKGDVVIYFPRHEAPERAR